MTPPEHNQAAIREVERKQKRRRRLPVYGILESMKVTLRTMLSPSATVHYPEEQIELPPRTRGVIALLEENCTVCMLCSKECPCWCIYIEGHKEQKEGRRKPVNALDRFAIDFGLCMYCGICVEVCPFDALHWSPEFEYTSYTYEGMVHERDVLTSWEELVLPPPELVDDADPDAKEAAKVAHDKRAEGTHAIIREQDKVAGFIADRAAVAAVKSPPRVPVTPYAPPVSATAPAASTAPAAPVADAPAPAVATPAAPAEAPAETAPKAEAAPATVETFGLPLVDPDNLPAGLGPVENGRMKRLAALQRKGKKPPDDLVANLKSVLDQLK